MEILLNSAPTLGEKSNRQLDLLVSWYTRYWSADRQRAKRVQIAETLLSLYLDLPAYPTESRNAKLLTQLLRKPEFGFLMHLSHPHHSATIYWMLNILHLSQEPGPVLWEEEQLDDIQSPWVSLWVLRPFDVGSLCEDDTGHVMWNEVDVMSSILCEFVHMAQLTLVSQYREERMDVDTAIVEHCLKSGLVGCGVRDAPPGDWASATGKWYLIAQPFLQMGEVHAEALGTFDVKVCTPDDMNSQYKAHMGEDITTYAESMLEAPHPVSDALPPLYFCGRNHAHMPSMGILDPMTPVFVRGVVRLTTDNPPVAYWSWVVDWGTPDDMFVARVVQMPGRGGSAFFGVSNE